MQHVGSFEKSKRTLMTVETMKRKAEEYSLRFDHLLQRYDGQWTSEMMGNLISDVLQNNPIPSLVFAEQVLNGVPIIWNLDGKQRCTNLIKYINNIYKISKKIRRGIIRYQVIKKDENGRIIFNEKGDPTCEIKEFDIRNKFFRDLPIELQNTILEYNLDVVQYINCSSDDIAYHIARYNEGKPMNSAQKGITRLYEDYAFFVRRISNSDFFTELAPYGKNDSKNGAIYRVIVESIMAINYLDSWKKDLTDACSYLTENGNSEIFETFEALVDRLTEINSEDVFSMFNSKDSFIWFAIFNRFTKLGLEDEKFAEFIKDYKKGLDKKKINGESFIDVVAKSRATKDKGVVVSKIDKIMEIMCDYFGIYNKEETQSEIENVDEPVVDFVDDATSSVLEFVKANVSEDVTELDIEDYESDLELLTLNVDNNSPLLDDKNKPSIIGIIAYSYEKDISIDDWFVDYFENNKTYKANQVDNLNDMIESLEKVA